MFFKSQVTSGYRIGNRASSKQDFPKMKKIESILVSEAKRSNMALYDSDLGRNPQKVQ